MNINDLQIEKGILPLFDNTINEFSNLVLKEMFTQPISSIKKNLDKLFKKVLRTTIRH